MIADPERHRRICEALKAEAVKCAERMQAKAEILRREIAVAEARRKELVAEIAHDA